MVPFITVQEYMETMSNLMRATNANTVLLLSETQSLRTAVRVLSAEVTDLRSAIGTSGVPAAEAVATAAPIAVTPARSLISEHFDRVVGATTVEPSRILPSYVVKSRSGLHVSEFIKKWYIEEWHRCLVTTESRSVLNRFARAICLLKYFVPPNTTIAAKPAGSAVELTAWIDNITKIAHATETNIVSFLQKRKVELAADSPIKKRVVKQCTTIESVYKDLNGNHYSITNAEYATMRPVNVIDDATTATGCPAYVYSSVNQFRK